jgi:hypothetical protein
MMMAHRAMYNMNKAATAALMGSHIHHDLSDLRLSDGFHAQQAGCAIANTTIPCTCHESVKGSALTVCTRAKECIDLRVVSVGIYANAENLVAFSHKSYMLVAMMLRSPRQLLQVVSESH